MVLGRSRGSGGLVRPTARPRLLAAARQQLFHADLVVVNKKDLVSPAQLHEVRVRVLGVGVAIGVGLRRAWLTRTLTRTLTLTR